MTMTSVCHNVSMLPILPDLEDIWKKGSKSSALMSIVQGIKLTGFDIGTLRPGQEVVDEVI